MMVEMWHRAHNMFQLRVLWQAGVLPENSELDIDLEKWQLAANEQSDNT